MLQTDDLTTRRECFDPSRPREQAERILLTAAMHDHVLYARHASGITQEHFMDQIVSFMVAGCVRSAKVWNWPDAYNARRLARLAYPTAHAQIDALVFIAENCRALLTDELVAAAVQTLTSVQREAAA